MIYFTSDIHFNHDKEFVYKERGFSSIEEHDKFFMDYFKENLNQDDEIYILGDIIMNETNFDIVKKYFDCFNCNIHIVLGNHDTDKKIESYKRIENVKSISFGERMKYKKYTFFLSHYPTITSNFDDGRSLKKKVINLCGHSHTKNKFEDLNLGCVYHVELDAHDNKMVSIDEIIDDLKNRG